MAGTGIEVYDVSGEWFGRLEDIVEELTDKGFEVVEANSEYIEYYDKDDNGYVARLGGTERTIYIDKITEI